MASLEKHLMSEPSQVLRTDLRVVDITPTRERLWMCHSGSLNSFTPANKPRQVLTLVRQVHDPVPNLGTVCKNLAINPRQNLIRLQSS